MASELLLDTGGLVCLLDRSQRLHEPVKRFFEQWQGAVVSTEAVLTESTHLLGRTRGGREACIDFFIAGGAVLVPSTSTSLGRCREFVIEYADLPMDFADASLAALAEELDTDVVLRTDRRDFGVYRIGGRRRFKIAPEPVARRTGRR
jgi:hypothetical protein